jgi:hypothetical protein
MLIQIVTHQPEVIVRILRGTPTWVWGLLAALLALGISQLRDRRAGLLRVTLLPVGMALFSALGTSSALGMSPQRDAAVAVWLASGFLLFLAVAPGNSGASYDPVRRTFTLPGSAAPLALILGIFLVKYVVGVELALAPQLVRDPHFALTVAGLYGALSGIFIGRAARLWRLALADRKALVA